MFAERFAAERTPADQVIDVAGIGEPLRWEDAYAIQCRHGERTSRTALEVVGQAVTFLTQARRLSTFATDERWGWEASSASGRRDTQPRVHRGRPPAGRRTWPPAPAGRPSIPMAGGGWATRATWPLDFTGIGQPWLRELVNSWTRIGCRPVWG